MRRILRSLWKRRTDDSSPVRSTRPSPLADALDAPRPLSPDEALHTVLGYHDRTRHFPTRYAPSLGFLDWQSQPDPFRRYDGAPAVELVFPDDAGPPYEPSFVDGMLRPAPVDLASISRLFADSLGLSAWKQTEGLRWSLRVNPSSGNLHPTEAYLVCGALPDLEAGVYHYDVYQHALERRAPIDPHFTGLLVGLTSIHLRESWKYGERAYRYCQHDVGHALAAVAISAAGLGWQARLMDVIDDDIAALLGVVGPHGAESEQPDLLLSLGGNQATPEATSPWMGTPNRLGDDHQDWPVIEHVARAASRRHLVDWPGWTPQERRFEIGQSDLSLRTIVHRRRSAVAMDATKGLTRSAFEQLLAKVLPGADQVPFSTLPWAPQVDLLLYVHRVAGVDPGLYALVRDSSRLDRLRAALDPAFAWESAPAGSHPPEGRPADPNPRPPLPLYRLRTGDVRSLAAGTSCGQQIAGDGVFAVAMLAQVGALRDFGAWFYRALHWECGAIGQQLYLEAEASGVRGTGIGCFFDSDSARAFGVSDPDMAVLYHFTVGGPIEDDRLETLPPYGHLERSNAPGKTHNA